MAAPPLPSLPMNITQTGAITVIVSGTGKISSPTPGVVIVKGSQPTH